MSVTIDTAFLQKVKKALGVSYSNFDDELTDLIEAALADLNLAGIVGANVALTNPLIRQAIITYCRMNFRESEEYDRLKASYDEQKAQLWSASGFTVWGSGS